MNHILLLPS